MINDFLTFHCCFFMGFCYNIKCIFRIFKLYFMAKIIFTKSNKEIEVADGEGIHDACEQVGVMFGCNVGVCGTCTVFIQEGHENLTERTQQEIDLLGDDENLRLACQCKITGGVVKIDY